jgi:hypothetical protein
MKKKFFVIIFFIFIYLVSISTFFNAGQISTSEKRSLGQLPKNFSLSHNFYKNVEKFFIDNFIFRENIIFIFSFYKYFIFSEAISDIVIIGKNGWFFLGDSNSREYFSNKKQLSEDTLSMWKKTIEIKTDIANSKNIDYFFLISPNKESIYPMYYPAKQENNTSIFDQLLIFFKNNNISIINLKKVFSNTNLPTYFKTDHHWNSFGAYKAYEAIMKSNPSMSSYFVKFNFKNKKTNGGDLINSMKLNNFIAEENNYEPESSFVPNCEEKIIDLKYKKFKHPTIVRECNNSKSKRKAVIFHDSFGPYFTNYFDVSFIQTIYIWDYPSTEEYKIIVNNLNPDIIIEQRVERHIAPFKPS